MDVRDQLVTAGVELLEREGLANLSQRQIALRAGVSHGAPRHYFPTYANLLAAIARRGVDDLDRIITRGLSADDPRAALTRTCRDVVAFAADRPAMFELIARHDLLSESGGDLRTTSSRWLVAVTARIRDIRPDRDHRHSLALWAGVQGVGIMFGRRSAEAITPFSVDPADIIDVLVDGALGEAQPDE